jgi:diaminohydroxyphosphoribosylaminopyrimidine deaminase/5-amino-6-(5-phosphoribosylamino)uracil reductase
MRRAIELSLRGRGRVEPNPMVGAVLVREGPAGEPPRVLGEGYHERLGGPHAEAAALADAAARGESPAGATMLVTLEPCVAFPGKRTPPCADALIAAGVARVVVAVADPFPAVAGGGIARLRSAGIRVETGLLHDEAVRANAPYFKLRRTGRPYVTAKWAQTLDGKLATALGDSRWISGEESRRRVHALRDRVDAILIGVGTALADDPLLTARLPDGGGRNPLRVVLDNGLDLPVRSKLARTARQTPVLVLHAPGAPPHRAAALRELGVETAELPWWDLGAALDLLGKRSVTNLLVEGGPKVLTSFLSAGLVDEAWVFVAPKLVGGRDAPTAWEGDGVSHIANARTARESTVEAVGPDALIIARFSDPLAWSGPG